MYPYLAPDTGGVAVVVCPGGSYFWHDMEAEGQAVGEWLSSQGISAYVLRYRVAGVIAFLTRFRLLFRGRRYPDAQEDLRQALRLVRSAEVGGGVDTERVGAMGFSAGGHLVLSAAELFDEADRPGFVVAVYPVVTMRKPYVHKRSRRALLGDNRKRSKSMQDSLSLELHVRGGMPPVLLVSCDDDPVVNPMNSVVLDSALTAARVEHLYLHYATGGHGFGASEEKGTAEAREWKGEFLRWLGSMKNYEKP